MRSAALLVVGDEILSGEIRDENGPFLLRRLRDLDVPVLRIVTAPDEAGAIEAELRHLRALADAVIVSGGIGPTHDDVTRPAVARALGVALASHAEAEARIRSFYADRVTDAELGMARMPRGARLLDGVTTNTFGFRIGGVFVLPGVPFLFRDIVEGLVSAFEGRPLLRAELTTRRREGEIARGLAALQGACLDVAIGSYPVFEEGRWHVRVVVRSASETALEAAVAEVRARLLG
jgi:molybdenum cofactor synthesis domain-containing protein